MTNQNLRLADRRNHRSVFFIGAGVLCAVAVTLAGCSSSSKKKEPSAALSHTKQVKTKQAKLAKSERARKATVQKLAIALADNKTLKKQLLGAKNTARKSRDELQAVDKDIADLEIELAKANAQPAKGSRAESEKQNNQVQAALAKADSALDANRIVHVLYRQSVKERAQVEQAAAKEAEALRDQLAAAKQQTSDAQAEVKTARAELATANAEIARLKAVPAEKSTSSATQQPAQPQ